MLTDFIDLIITTSMGTANWVWRNIVFDVPWNQNYFWGLTLISVGTWCAELCFPWRKEQAVFRHNFWQDGFYMYFNFFIFSIGISGVYTGISYLLVSAGLAHNSLSLIELSQWPMALQLIVFFVILDFVQWLTHRALHRFTILWRFHQIHHSIKEMGFAGHLRYHWMENVLYKPLKTLAVMILGGFEPEQAFIVHFFTIIIGHINHANVRVTYGPLRYVFNNPVMHLYHHAYKLPQQHQHGVNFGITLSVWDYLFKTAYVPEDSGNVLLGFAGEQTIPPSFFKQLCHGFSRHVVK